MYYYLYDYDYDSDFRFTYEIAPVFVLMEQLTLKKMREIIGWPEGEGDGIFSPGKSQTAPVVIEQQTWWLCFVCFICLLVSRIKLKVINWFPLDFVEGWDMTRGSSDYI